MSSTVAFDHKKTKKGEGIKMKYCKDCVYFGKNLDKEGMSWCWSGNRLCEKSEGACLVFKQREGGVKSEI